MGNGKLAVYVCAISNFFCHGNHVTPMHMLHGKIVESIWALPSLPSFLSFQFVEKAQRRKKNYARKKGILQQYQVQ